MIKKIITTCLLMLGGLVKAQEKPQVTQLANDICAYYNKAQYRDIYTMLSPDFRKEFPKEQITTFFRDNVRAYGKIHKVRYLDSRNNAENYLMTCENGKLQLVLYPGPDNKINGMQWLPYKETPSSATKEVSCLSDNPLKTVLDVEVDSAARRYMLTKASCGVSVAVYQDGNYYYYNYGETTRGNQILPSRNSVYEIGSITKTFTGVLLAQAVSDRKLKLTDDIRNYLPGSYPNLEYKGQPLKIEHLANHTAGFPSVPTNYQKQPDFDPLDPYKNYNRDMIFAFLKTIKIKTVPGTYSSYSNMGMAVLGLILENVYHESYSELLVKYITAPNGWTSTSISMSADALMRRVPGYNEEGVETPYWVLNDFAAAGGLNSTSKELLDYFVWNMCESTEALKLAHAPTWAKDKNSVALAWHIIETGKGNKLLWHNGGTYGFSSFGGFIKSRNCAVVVLSNSGARADDVGLEILNVLQ